MRPNATHKLQGRGAFTPVWGTPAGGASPYENRWPRPVNFMRLLGHSSTELGQIPSEAGGDLRDEGLQRRGSAATRVA
jgi:hypothetical protein